MSPGEKNCHKKPCKGIKVAKENAVSFSESLDNVLSTPKKQTEILMSNILNDMFEALDKIKHHTNEEVNDHCHVQKFGFFHPPNRTTWKQ